MRIGKIIYRFNAAAVALLLVALTVAGATDKNSDKKITFTTKSKEAREYVAQIVHSIESFRNPPEWLPLAQKAVEADPEFAFGHYLIATGTPPPENRKHADKAVELAKNASEGERRYIEAVLLVRSQQGPKGLEILLDLAKKYPEERMVQMMLGQVYTNQGKLNEATAAFERASQLDGSTPRVYTFLGNIHLLKGDYAKARQFFNTALAKKADKTAPFGPHYGIAYSHIYESNWDGALKALNTYREEYERTGQQGNFPPVFIWNSIGRVLLESGRPAEAIKAYEKGYESIPASNMSENDKKTWLGRVHHGKGRALAKLGKHEEAWKEADTIKKMIDEGGEQGQQFMPAYHYIAGYLKLEAGDYAKAVEHLKQSDLNDPFHKLLLARAYEKAGDQASAQKLYKEITESTQITIERALSYPEAKKKLKV
jgi:tetratricopeptide (TPR) repeat protein